MSLACGKVKEASVVAAEWTEGTVVWGMVAAGDSEELAGTRGLYLSWAL